METIITRLVICLFFVTAITTIPLNASASIWVCWNGDPCFELEGTCDGWCSGSNGQPTCSDCGIATFNPNTDYILSSSTGEAWIVQGNKQSRIASDMMASFISITCTKYAKANRNDKKIQAQITAEYNAFLKKDDHKVSAKRLALNSKETGLKVVQQKASKATK